MRIRFALFTIIPVLLIACAEQRRIEKVPDGDKEILSKEVFTKKYTEKEIAAKGLLGSGDIWFSKVTVVKTSGNGGFVATGKQSAMKAGRFRFTKDQLRFENANTVNTTDSSVAGELLASWSVRHFDSRLREVDGRPTNIEEEDFLKGWEDKQYFRVDWADTDVTEGIDYSFSDSYADVSSCWTKNISQLVADSREVTEDYVGFTLSVDYTLNQDCQSLRKWIRDDNTFTAHFKFSFMKAKSSTYKPMVYSGEQDPLMKRYGYFQTVVEKKGDPKRGDVYPYKVGILANRWHPDKKHIFYFAEDFPEEWKWIYNDPVKGVFAKTNALFAKNGLNDYDSNQNSCSQGICFQILENDGSKEFGDLRYSFIKLVDEHDPSSPLGYAPMDANPFSGEIISANTVLWTSTLEFMLARLSDDIDRQTGDAHFKNSSLIQNISRVLGSENKVAVEDYRKAWTVTASRLSSRPEALDAFYSILPEFTFGFPGWARFTGQKLDQQNRSSDQGVPPFLNPKSLNNEFSFDFSDFATFEEEAESLKNPLNHESRLQEIVYYGEPHFADAREMILNGKSQQEAMETILYRVAIHEFGHNLNLRHNFYGSVDKRHFHKGSKSSSVMDYQRVHDSFEDELDWGAYDEAALVFAYSNGDTDLAKINNTSFLFCSDEHAILNALCNPWDAGTSPSEIALQMVEDYDLMYKVMNQRFDRPYWSTRGYPRYVAGVMLGMKQFLGLYKTGMLPFEMEAQMSLLGTVEQEDVAGYTKLVRRDIEQANKIAVAFYDAVLNIKQAEKDFESSVAAWSGETSQIGIALDKLFAMYFLMSDDPILYNPNRYRIYTSYVDFAEESTLSPVIDRVLENIFASRLDMRPGFSSFGRKLFAQNAYNHTNRADSKLLDRIKVDCFTAERFGSELGIRSNLSSDVQTLDYSKVHKKSDYQDVAGTTEKVGWVKIDNNYYVSRELKNRYSFRLIESMLTRYVNTSQPGSLGRSHANIKEAYGLYWGMKNQEGWTQCRSGKLE